jgi:hypothetical protein
VSVVLKSVLNALALEEERVRRALRVGAYRMIPSAMLPQFIEASPSLRGDIDATNIVVDPQGLGAATTWSATGGELTFDDQDPPRGFSRSGGVLPAGGTTVLVGTTFVAASTETHYWYALVRSTLGTAVTVRLINVGTAAVVGSVTLLGQGTGWQVVQGGAAELVEGTLYRVQAYSSLADGSTTTVASTTARLWLSGVTVTPGIDPKGAFSGDSATTAQHAYSWQAGRNGSPSRRHTRYVDLLSDIEEEREFGIVPEGLTWDQRREYWIRRIQAYNKPYSEVLRDLLLLLIRTENPSATASSVRIIETVAEYRFRVEIGYAETGPLAQRLRQLIADVQPAHLELEDIVWGTFQADISEAGDPV